MDSKFHLYTHITLMNLFPISNSMFPRNKHHNHQFIFDNGTEGNFRDGTVKEFRTSLPGCAPVAGKLLF